MEPRDKDVVEQLRGLPERAPPPATSERIHRIARARFLRRAAEGGEPWWLAWLGRAYDRVELPLAAGVVIVYLGWAAVAAMAAMGVR
jgi:hypothetical protein